MRPPALSSLVVSSLVMTLKLDYYYYLLCLYVCAHACACTHTHTHTHTCMKFISHPHYVYLHIWFLACVIFMIEYNLALVVHVVLTWHIAQLVKWFNTYVEDRGEKILLVYYVVIREIICCMPWNVCPEDCNIVLLKHLIWCLFSWVVEWN